MNDKPLYYKYWGKARKKEDGTCEWHLLPYHCLDVAAVGRVLIENDQFLNSKLAMITGLLKKDLIALIPFFISFHDVGKFSKTFQSLEPGLMKSLLGTDKLQAYSHRHDILSRVAWKKIILPELIRRLQVADEYLSEALTHMADTVCGHHGKPVSDRDGLNAIPVDCFFDSDDKNAAQTFINECFSLFGIETNSFPADIKTFEKAMRHSSWPIAGLVVIADWIGSNIPDFFKPISENLPLSKYWIEYAMPQASEAVLKTGLHQCKPANKTGYNKLFPKIQQPSKLQKVAETLKISNSPTLYIIEDTTGSGKTEAALMVAHRLISAGQADGMYFALPTMATADAMYKRISEMYLKLFSPGENPSLVLAHSSRLLSEPFMRSIAKFGSQETKNEEEERTTSAVCASWLADSAKKAMLAHVGVGTIDQALTAILRARHQSLKVFGLFRKVIIVDEVHAYDAYVEGLLETLLKFHYALDGSAILLSATLTGKTKDKFHSIYSEGRLVNTEWNEYPLFSFSSKGNEPKKRYVITRKELKRQVNVHFLKTPNEAISVLLESASKDYCCCWIRNTVDDALESYRLLVEKYDQNKIVLLHARFAMCDRRSIEDNAINISGPDSTHDDRKGKIIVATQVIEQSLDLDFDEMITDIAPIDLIIQRAGRLKRHIRNAQGNRKPHEAGLDERGNVALYILAPKFEENPKSIWLKKNMPGTAAIYDDHVQIWKTQKYLLETPKNFGRNKIGWKQPKDFRNLIEYVYSEKDIPSELSHRHDTSQGNDQAAHGLSRLNSLNVDWGYTAKEGIWEEDVNLPTRIGKQATKVVLCKWIDGKLEFWCGSNFHAAELSMVIVNDYWIKIEAPFQGALARAIELIKKELPYDGKGIVLLPLVAQNGKWCGPAINKNGQKMNFYYSSTMGLTWKKGGDDAVQPDS